MIERISTRVRWLEKNLLPYEAEIRRWLKSKRVQDLDIDDVVQEMYARIGSVDDLESIRSPRSYAFQVASSVLLNHLRRPQIVTITRDGDLDALPVASTEGTPEDNIALKEEVREVADAIAALPWRTRAVLLLRRVEGLSQRETAERLAIAEKTVEKHLARATLALMMRFGRGGKSSARPSSLSEPAGRSSESDDRTD